MPLFVIPATDAAQLAEGPAAVPWTDGNPSERHEREAFVRLCELAIETARNDDDLSRASWLAIWAGDDDHDRVISSEQIFRCYLNDLDGFDPARVDREVALVRLRAEMPEAATTCCTICSHPTNWHEPAGCGGCVCAKTPPDPFVVDDHCEFCGEYEAECSCGGET